MFSDVFRDADVLSNNQLAWVKIAGLLDEAHKVIQGNVLPSLTTSVDMAQRASAVFFCAIVTAKQEHIDLQFDLLFDKAPGKSYSAKLINWVISKCPVTMADNVKLAWSGMHKHMCSAIEVMIRKIDPIGGITVDEAEAWIKANGGLSKLHWQYVRLCADDKERERERAEHNARRAHLLDAMEAGFGNDVEAYDAHLAQVERAKREETLTGKMAQFLQQLVERGTRVGELPSDTRLLIVSDGVLYQLTDADAESLLRCGASTL